MKAWQTSSLVCTDTGTDGPDLGAVLTRGTAESSSDFLWGAAAAPLFSRRTRSAVGTNRVISALGLVICGLALIVAMAFFSMVLRLCHPPWVAGSSWGQHLEPPGWVRELVGRALVGQVQEEAPEVGASCQDGVEGYLDKGEHNNKM